MGCAGLGRHDLVKYVVEAASRYTTLTLSPKAAKLAMSRLLNAKTDYGQTALMLACKRGCVLKAQPAIHPNLDML